MSRKRVVVTLGSDEPGPYEPKDADEVQAFGEKVLAFMDSLEPEPWVVVSALAALLPGLLEFYFDQGFHKASVHVARQTAFSQASLLVKLLAKQAACPGCGGRKPDATSKTQQCN